MLRVKLIAAVLMSVVAMPAFAERSPAPDGAEAYVISPADGATLTSPVTVVFGARNIGIAPAGIEMENTGHHHLLVNIEPDEIDLENPLPATDELIHFGGGQTEASVELPAGTHVLRVLMADHNHIPHEPPLFSSPVTIVVE